MAKLTGGHLFIRCLKQEGIQKIFTIVGDTILPLVDAAAERLQIADPVAAAKLHDGGLIQDPVREQQVLERRIFVPTLARIGQRGVKGLFEIGGKAGHSEVFRLGLAKGEHGTAYGPKVSQSCIGRRYGPAGR